MRERTKLLVLLLTVYSCVNTFAQTGSIKGSVFDKSTGETLIGATILLEGTTKGTISDFDGNFELSLVQPGKYNIICQFVSYETQKLSDVTIEDNEEFVSLFYLEEEVTKLDEVKVVARKRRESEQLLLTERKEASFAVESIGAQELARKGAGNVATGVKKISGVSMIGNHQLFVRGLGDRYNSIQFNGLPIASPDPTKKIIKLDIFPTDIVEALIVSKVFNVNNYADYTGALINIYAKKYPTSPFIKLDFELGYNNLSTLKDFKQMEVLGGQTFGLNLEQRRKSVPENAKQYNLSQKWSENIFDASMEHSNSTSMPNQNYAISAGKLFNIGNKQLGLLVSSKLNNDYKIFLNTPEVVLRADGTNQSKFTKDSYVYGTNFSNLVNLSYKQNVDNRISFNFLFLRNTSDRLSEKTGRTYDNEVFVRYGEFKSHTLISNQLFGQHTINDKLMLNWGAGYQLASSETPDTRQLVLEQGSDAYYFFDLNAQETMRKVSELNESEFSSKINIEYKFSNAAKLQVGGQALLKSRSYDAFLYYYNVKGISNSQTNSEYAAGLLNNENFANGSVSLKNGSIYNNKYNADLKVTSAYINYIHILNKLTVDFGVRVELSQMNIQAFNESGFPDSPIKLINNDFFPAIHIKYKTTTNSNFRLSASRTITRPSFNEKSTSKLVPEYGKPLEHGNPELINSLNSTIDIKWEIFPHSHELVSIGFYAKVIENPIERVARKSGGNNIYTYQNTSKGIVSGAELELKKKWSNIITGVNASYIFTQINIPENANETNKERALQGASPYIVNADIGYIFNYGSDNNHTSSISAIYNVYGRRLWSVGADGIGDSYEMPYHTLKLLIRNDFNKKLSVSFSVENILDQQITLEQDYYTESGEILQKQILQIPLGTEFKLGLSYKF